jgi:hypothetical protein
MSGVGKDTYQLSGAWVLTRLCLDRRVMHDLDLLTQARVVTDWTFLLR